MSIFTRHPTPSKPAPLSGTDTLRLQLKSRLRHRSLGQICGDINDEAVVKANRITAAAMAKRMIGDDAAAAAVASVAKTLMNGFGTDVNKEVRTVNESALQSLVDGGEISSDIKVQIAMYLSGGYQTFDAEMDALVPAIQHPPQYVGVGPPQIVNADPAIAAAQRALYKAIAEASH